MDSERAGSFLDDPVKVMNVIATLAIGAAIAIAVWSIVAGGFHTMTSLTLAHVPEFGVIDGMRYASAPYVAAASEELSEVSFGTGLCACGFTLAVASFVVRRRQIGRYADRVKMRRAWRTLRGTYRRSD